MACSSVRCVSCSARIAIRLSFMNWCKMFHLLLEWSVVSEPRPFMFREATRREALVLFLFSFCLSSAGSGGVSSIPVPSDPFRASLVGPLALGLGHPLPRSVTFPFADLTSVIVFILSLCCVVVVFQFRMGEGTILPMLYYHTG